jgi:hypothetical protein
MSEACHFFLVPSWSSSTPLYPSIVLRAREYALTSCPSIVFSLGLTFEPLKELGMRHSFIEDGKTHATLIWSIMGECCYSG